jgi:hypothetical protein
MHIIGGHEYCTDFAGCPFEPWESFRTNIRPDGPDPLYVTDAVDTYYHDWQVLLVADALDMGMRVIFDTRRPELMTLALHGDIRNLPDDVVWQEVSFQGPRALTQGLRWARFFDAFARVESMRARKFNAISRVYGGASFTFTRAEQDDLNATQKRAAEEALAAIGASSTEIIDFLTYLCERWNDWTGRGRQDVPALFFWRRQDRFFIFGERCADLARRRSSRAHSLPPNSRRATPPVCPDLIYDRQNGLCHVQYGDQAVKYFTPSDK